MSEAVTNITDPTMAFLLGVFGGFLAELGRWWKIREGPNFPTYIKTAFYWVITILMIIAGGGLAYVYMLMGDLNAILAVNVGTSAPLIISSLASTPPKQVRTGKDEALPEPKLRDFLSWR